MSIWGPVIAVVLALVFVAGVALIAWKASSDEFLRSFDHDASDVSDIHDTNDPPV